MRCSYGVYVISSYIFALQNRVVKGVMKTALQPGVYAVINVCTSFEYVSPCLCRMHI